MGLLAGVLALVLGLCPPAGTGSSVAVRQDRVYRAGVFLVVDALAENRSGGRIARAEASVELYDFFDGLLGVERTVLAPLVLEPGHVAALRVATPYTDAARTIVYRFSWWQDGAPRQEAVPRVVWRIGEATRDACAG
jgi:hypothetical protein